MSERRRVTARATAQLINLLIAGRHSREGLAQASGLAQPTVAAWLREFRHAGLVRLCDWERDSRGYPTIDLFCWAPGEADAVKPMLTAAQRQARRRAALKEKAL
ncbi:MAG: hypothetical protein Q8K24_08855 [Hydrogenophaga sp.]|nr:hypothetical protein [Hydrogenophaga sp.]